MAEIKEFPKGTPNEEQAVKLLDSFFENGQDNQLDLEEFAAILALPDEIFGALSELILEEIQKAANNPRDRILMQQELKASGFTALDFMKLQNNLFGELEKEFGNDLSPMKIDFLKRMMGIIVSLYSELEGNAKTIINIPIQVLDYGILPTYAHDGDAAMDIYSPYEYDIAPGETVLIPTGLKMAIPRGYGLIVQARSGMSLKTKLRLANSLGLIDSKKEASQWAA